MSRATYNFHLPLPPEIHEMLRQEVESSGQPATTLAREALHDWLVHRKRQRLHEEIAAFAEAHAGTDLDLDEDLERAGIEAILSEDHR
ncbi:MAG TPA: hypothetical protein VEW48_27180 [Thermoanaerobaculia bacterium]|nr:hypothetical protein [Thermoanaerobaculia bacterium]